MKKFKKGIICKVLILTMLVNVFFTAIAPNKTVFAITPNTISFNSDPFGSNFRTQPYDVNTTDFGQITFKGTDDSLATPFGSLSWMAGQGMVHAGYYTGDSSWYGLMLSADGSNYTTGIWFVFGTKDRSKKFSVKSFNVGEYGNIADTMEVIGLLNGVQVASQIVTFDKYSLTTKTVTMSSGFEYVDEVRMRQKTEGLYNGGYPGFEGIVVNDFVLGDPMIPKLEFSPTNYSIGENGGIATLTVKRIGSSNGAATVDYATSDGIALAGRDYTSASGTLTFASGSTYTFPTTEVSNNTAEAQVSIGYLESKDDTLVISSDIASLSIPASSLDLSGVSGKGYVKVTFKIISGEDNFMLFKKLPMGLKVVENPLNLTIQLFDENGAFVRDIHNFKSNEKLKVSIKLTSDDIKNLDINKLSMYTYNETNGVWEELGGGFNPITKEFTFYTSHFSVFAVVEKTSATNTLPKAGSLFNFYTIISLGITLTLLGVVLLRRKSKIQ